MLNRNFAPIAAFSGITALSACSSSPVPLANPQEQETTKTQQLFVEKVPRSIERVPSPVSDRLYMKAPETASEFTEMLSICRSTIEASNIFADKHVNESPFKGCRSAQMLIDNKQRVIDICGATANVLTSNPQISTIRLTLKEQVKLWQEEVDETKKNLPECFKDAAPNVNRPYYDGPL